MSFIELSDFMIYQHVNKKTKTLPQATSHLAHLCTQIINVCTANFCAIFKALIFIKLGLKLSYFCKKMQNYLCAAGGFTPRPPATCSWGLCSKAFKTPPITKFWLRAWCFYCCYVILCKLILRLARVYGFSTSGSFFEQVCNPWRRV